MELVRSNAPKPVDGIRVGIGGWTYAPWRDNFYPKGLVQRRELEYASRQLTAIEVNGTYYGAQKPATYAKWAAETPDGFVFSAKAPMRIMQSRTLAKTGPQIDDFLGGIASLGDRLGPIVWQFDAGPRAASATSFAAVPANCCPTTSKAARCGMCSTCATRTSSTPTTSRSRASTAWPPCSPIRTNTRRSPTSPPTSSTRA